MPDIDNKIVSISFNNKQFLKDIDETMDAILKFNNATSGKNIDTSGLESLKKAFQTTTSGVSKDAESLTNYLTNISKAADGEFKTGGIDALRKALENAGTTAVDVEDTITALQQLSKTGVSYASDLGISNAQTAAASIQQESNNTRTVLTQDIDDVTDRFSMLRMIGMGAAIAIGEKMAGIGMNLIHQFNGITDGWQEYNSLTNSTQTILANTERYGSTMEDVSNALGELNHYADLTTYAFSDMTRNIGYFTTAGVNLEDSVTAIKGLSNVGALFGADAQSVARAGYQMSQAMSAGVIKLMDWRSMVNAGMGGQALQDELIRTAAVMSGTSIDAMNDYIEGLGGFNASLQTGWLTSDIFLETLRKFAGQSREYYEQLTDENGNRLYTDEEIDQMVKLGETAMESATKVRTFQQMMDAFKESIGSGWQQTFSLIIGNLEEAKEFWTPINDILTSLVNGFFELQNGALESWRSWGGREELLAGIQNVLSNISGILTAIGKGFIAAFGGSWAIGPRLYGITEALTDLTEALMLSDEEIGYVKDLFEGLFQPIRLIVDILFELGMALFNSGDAAGQMEQSADSLYGGIKSFKTSILQVLGYIGSILTAGAKFIRQNEIVKKVTRVLAQVISKSFGIISKVIAAPFILFYQIWERYNIGGKLEEFWYKVVEYFMPIADAVTEVKNVFESWFKEFKLHLINMGLRMRAIEYVSEMFDALKQLFKDLFDPTVTIREAFGNFVDTLSNGNIGRLLEEIKNGFGDLWNQLKDTTLGQWFTDLKDKIQNAWESLSQTPFGQWIGGIIDNIKEFLGVDTGKWDTFWDTTEQVVTTVADALATGWEKIKTFFGELIDIFKDWFGISDQAQESTEALEESAMGAVGDGTLSGQIAQSGNMMAIISESIMTAAENINKAEKLVPEPSESKFLAFLRSIPESISGLVDTISHSKIIKNIKEFFILLGNSISSFFNQDLHEQKSDILSFFSDRIEDVENLIGGLLGIDDFKFGEYGIFETIAATIASFINAFGAIDMKAFFKAQSVLSLVGQFVGFLVSIKIADTFITLASMGRNLAIGYKKSQQAVAKLADASRLAAMGQMFLSFGLVLLTVLATVVLVATMIENGKGEYLAVAFVGILVVMWVLIKFTEQVAKQAKQIKTLAASMRSIASVFKAISGILLSIIGVVAVMVGLAMAVSFATGFMSDSQLEYFEASLIAIAIGFALIAIAVGALIGVVLHSVNKVNSGIESYKSSGIAKVFESVSGILISMGVLVGILVASVIGLTIFLNSLEGDYETIGIAAGSIAVVLLLAAGAVALLVLIANKVSSTTSAINPKTFKSTIGMLAVLMAAVVGSIVALLAAMVGIVMISGTVENAGWKFAGATAIIVVLVGTVMGSLALLVNAISKAHYGQNSKVVTFFSMLMLLIAEIAVIAGGAVYFVNYLSTTVSSVDKLYQVLGAIGVALAGVLGATAVVVAIVASIDLRKTKVERLRIFEEILASVLGTILIIALSLSAVVGAMSNNGFISQGGSIWSVMGAMAVMFEAVAVMMGLFGVLLKSDVLDEDGLWTVSGSIIIASMSLIIIASALALVARAVPDTAMLWTAFGTISILAAVLLGSLIALTAISKSDISAVMVSALSMLTASLAFLIMGDAISRIADIDTVKLWTAMGVLIGMTLVMGGIMIALTALGHTGIGIAAIAIAAVAILALGAAYLMMGESINRFGTGLDKAVSAVERFSEAINSLKNIDLAGIRSKIVGLIGIGLDAADELIDVAKRLGAAISVTVASLISGAIIGLAAGWRDGLVMIRDFIMTDGESIVGAFEYLGLLILDSLHETLTAFKDTVIADFGPGGNIRQIAGAIEGFVLWLSGQTAMWTVDIIEAAVVGLTSALSNENKLRRIGIALKILYLTIKKDLMNLLGVPDFKELGKSIVNKILQGMANALKVALNNPIIGGAGGLTSLLGEVLDVDVDGVLEGFANTFGNKASTAWSNAWDSTHLDTEISDLQADMDRLAESSDEASTSVGDIFTGLGEKLGLVSDGAGSAGGVLDTLLGKVRGFLGIDEDFSLSGLFENFDLNSVLGNFGGDGLSSLTDSFGNLGDSMGGMSSMSSILDMSPDQVTQLSDSLGGVTDVFNADEISNPVLTPTVDTSQVAFGIDSIEEMFNNANISDFAIDAGNSILTAERANGNVASDGSVTQNYTYIQNIDHADSASPIQIYRDTNSLLRGHVG